MCSAASLSWGAPRADQLPAPRHGPLEARSACMSRLAARAWHKLRPELHARFCLPTRLVSQHSSCAPIGTLESSSSKANRHPSCLLRHKPGAGPSLWSSTLVHDLDFEP